MLPSHSGAPGTVRAGDALVLHPLVAPDSAAGWMDDYGNVCLAIRYAVPVNRRGFDVPPPTSLEALVGPQRARLLVHLERPASAGVARGTWRRSARHPRR